MTTNTPHVIIFSHGFGVRKTDRGLFTAIAKAMPSADSVMFDYNSFHEESNTLTVTTLQDQAQKLRKVINAVRVDYPGATIDLVCHSQGCVIAGLVKPRGIRRVVMITPPDDMSLETIVEQMGDRKDVAIDVNARTRLARTDGSTTVIHPEYWRSLEGIKPVKLYNRLARFTKFRIINARQDEVLGTVALEGIDPTISIVTLDGTHNFDEEAARNQLVYILQKELALN